jgi:hypothetical protein
VAARRPGAVDIEGLLQALSRPLRRRILEDYRADSCIPSTRIAVDLLAELGLKARPLRVTLHAFTLALAERITQEGHLPTSKEELIRWCDETQGWSIGVGFSNTDPMAMHLVALVEEAWVWDLSADQASRPQRGIWFPMPLVFPATAEFMRGQSVRLTSETAVAYYTRHPGKDSPWSQTNSWRRDGADADLRQAIVQEMLEAIGRWVR